MRYSLEPSYRKYVQGQGYMSFAKNMSNKYGKKLLDKSIDVSNKYGRKLLDKSIDAGKDFAKKAGKKSRVKWGHLGHFDPTPTNTIFPTNPMGSSGTL